MIAYHFTVFLATEIKASTIIRCRSGNQSVGSSHQVRQWSISLLFSKLATRKHRILIIRYLKILLMCKNDFKIHTNILKTNRILNDHLRLWQINKLSRDCNNQSCVCCPCHGYIGELTTRLCNQLQILHGAKRQRLTHALRLR